MRTMIGSPAVPFSTLIGDTINNHGIRWAWNYYSKRGMTQKEFRIWAKSTYAGKVA